MDTPLRQPFIILLVTKHLQTVIDFFFAWMIRENICAQCENYADSRKTVTYQPLWGKFSTQSETVQRLCATKMSISLLFEPFK